jgi:hypothetical protein
MSARLADRLTGARWRRAGLVALGVIALQAALFGPSLVGRKILLPVDLLAQPGNYLPQSPPYLTVRPHDLAHSDQVLQYEPVPLLCGRAAGRPPAPLGAL